MSPYSLTLDQYDNFYGHFVTKNSFFTFMRLQICQIQGLSANFQTAINLTVFNIFGWIFFSHARNYLNFRLQKNKNYFCLILPEKWGGVLRIPPLTNRRPQILCLIGLLETMCHYLVSVCKHFERRFSQANQWRWPPLLEKLIVNLQIKF